MDFFFPFNYPWLQLPIVCRVSYIDSDSVEGWDGSYCLLSWLSSQITWAPTLYIPLPQHQYVKGMTEEKEGDGGGGKQKVRGHCLFLCFQSSHVTMTRRLPPEAKAGEKVGCGGKVRISLGGKCTTTAEARAFPCISSAPSAYSTTHTRAYIFTVSTKPSLCQGPFAFKCLEPSMEIRNIHSRMSPWLCAACSAYYYSCVCLYMCVLVYLRKCMYV